MASNRFTSVLMSACLCLAVQAQEGDHKPTAKHAKAGVSCYDCHRQEKPSKAPVPMESCMACHGDYPAMAEYTSKLPLNPHKPPTPPKHPGPFACTECHRQHQKPVVKCLECHADFKLKLS